MCNGCGVDMGLVKPDIIHDGGTHRMRVYPKGDRQCRGLVIEVQVVKDGRWVSVSDIVWNPREVAQLELSIAGYRQLEA